VLAEFISSGEYAAHLRRVRKIYMSRRDCLLENLSRRFGEITINGSQGGTRLHWILPTSYPTAESIKELALKHEVSILIPEPKYCDDELKHRILTFCYAQVNEWKIREGVNVLGRVIDRLLSA
jgi:GntR family transcriptional regulator/MocR family aminotransferase